MSLASSSAVEVLYGKCHTLHVPPPSSPCPLPRPPARSRNSTGDVIQQEKARHVTAAAAFYAATFELLLQPYEHRQLLPASWTWTTFKIYARTRAANYISFNSLRWSKFWSNDIRWKELDHLRAYFVWDSQYILDLGIFDLMKQNVFCSYINIMFFYIRPWFCFLPVHKGLVRCQVGRCMCAS